MNAAFSAVFSKDLAQDMASDQVERGSSETDRDA